MATKRPTKMKAKKTTARAKVSKKIAPGIAKASPSKLAPTRYAPTRTLPE